MSPALILCLALTAQTARAGSVDDVARREEGVALGVCALTPKPGVSGNLVHAVVPARFEDPGIWGTRTLLLVGVDGAGQVTGELAVRMPERVAPREVISLTCRRNVVTIRSTDGTDVFRWDGQGLRKGR